MISTFIYNFCITKSSLYIITPLNRVYTKKQIINTSIFDKICNHHFSQENENIQIYKCFLGLIGLHYPINKYNRFNCTFYIKGDTNTGKSATSNIVMSNHQNKGTISAKMEDTFGFESLIDKNVIYI